MIRFNTRLLAVMLCASVLAFSGHAVATQPPAGQTSQQQESRAPISQREALERVRARFPGEVISITEVRQGDRVRYRVRLDNEGNIYTVYVDRATGAISRE